VRTPRLPKKRQAESPAAVCAMRFERERAAVERAVADYYNSLGASEVAELADWGEFALSQLREATL
jgi:hypothetical protein